MPISLRPRHPADIAAAQAETARRRPSLVLKRGPNPLFVVIPAILTALAVYVGLVYVDKITRRISESPEGAGADSKEWFIRGVDNVVITPSVLEQPPPPAPELVREEYLRTHPLRTTAPGERAGSVPVLIPELEPSQMPLNAIPLAPMETLSLPAVGLPDAHE